MTAGPKIGSGKDSAPGRFKSSRLASEHPVAAEDRTRPNADHTVEFGALRSRFMLRRSALFAGERMTKRRGNVDRVERRKPGAASEVDLHKARGKA